MERRAFLKKTAVAAGVLGMGKPLSQQKKKQDRHETGTSSLARRKYGRHSDKLSIVGFGGIVVMNADQEHANKVVAESVGRGVNYFDVAPSYGDAEIKLGPALEPYRKNCFLACKTLKRRQGPARNELKQSFERLRTDYFDLYQLHALTDVEKDVDVAFAKGGVMEMIAEARKAGQIRYVGFSAHSEEAALAAMDRYDFDSILFPVNFCTLHQGNFGWKVIETANKKNVAILALKTFAKQKWPDNHPQRETYSKCWYEPVTPEEMELARMAMAFTLSQPITALLPPGEESLFRMALDLADNVQPLTASQQQKLKATATELNPIFSSKA